MELFISLASFVLSVVIIFYVIRWATRADEILAALNQHKIEQVTEIKVTNTENVLTTQMKSDEEYLREARAKYGE